MRERDPWRILNLYAGIGGNRKRWTDCDVVAVEWDERIAAIYQRLQGHAACEGLDHFPVERIVEIHVAGGTEGSWDGFAYVEDDHQLTILPDTWEILDSVAKRAPNLRAVVLECERNPLEEAAPAFRKLQDRLAPTPFGQAKRSAS